MPSVPIDINDKGKGFYWVSEEPKAPQRTINDVLAIWICLQLYSGQTPKQIQRQLKVHTLQQIKNVPNAMYKNTGSTYMQWFTSFLPEGNVRGAGELYYLRMWDLERMQREISINPHEKYETKDEYLRDVERLKESTSLLIECFYKETEDFD